MPAPIRGKKETLFISGLRKKRAIARKGKHRNNNYRKKKKRGKGDVLASFDVGEGINAHPLRKKLHALSKWAEGAMIIDGWEERKGVPEKRGGPPA